MQLLSYSSTSSSCINSVTGKNYIWPPFIITFSLQCIMLLLVYLVTALILISSAFSTHLHYFRTRLLLKVLLTLLWPCSLINIVTRNYSFINLLKDIIPAAEYWLKWFETLVVVFVIFQIYLLSTCTCTFSWFVFLALARRAVIRSNKSNTSSVFEVLKFHSLACVSWHINSYFSLVIMNHHAPITPFLTEASQATISFPAFNDSCIFSQNGCFKVSSDGSTSTPTPSVLIILTTPPLNVVPKMSF